MAKQKKKEETSTSVEPTPTYTHYRSSTVGVSLQDAIDELIQENKMSQELKEDVMAQFDKTIIDALVNKVKAKTTFKGQCNTFRFVDDVYMFELRNALFKVESESFECGPVKIVACDGKPNAQKAKKGRKKKNA